MVLSEKEKRVGVGEWRNTTIGDCTLINDSTYSPKEAWPFVNYLDTGNITENRISEIQHLIVGKDKIPSRARRKAQPGDIVYSTVRPNQRHFGLLKEVPKNFLASTGFSVIRGKGNLAHTNFIYWFLAQDHIVELLHTIAEHSTSAYPSIRPVDIEELNLCLPPLPEQRAIAHVLGTLDDKIELNRRMNETLEAMARALFKSWFVDFDPVHAKMEGRDTGLPRHIADLFPDRLVDSELGEIPEGWEVGTIRQLAERIQNGGTPKRSEPTYWECGEIPWLTSGEIRQSLILGTQNFISEEGLAKSSAKIVPARSILVALYGATAGQVSMNYQPLSTNQAISAIIPSTGNRYFCLMSLKLKVSELENRAVGSAQQNISKKIVEDTMILLPRLELRSTYDALVKPLFDRNFHNLDENQTLSTSRDALLPKLISGKLRVG